MRRLTLLLALLAGILAVSTASTFVRFAQQAAPSLVIAACRLGIATLVLAPAVLARHRTPLRALTLRDLGLALLAGVFLALHFATWITSLEHTSVVSSVVIVTTSPLWVALLSPLVLRERLSAVTLLGVALALAGGMIVVAAGPAGPAGPAGAAGGSRQAPLGNLLALAGAWMMAGYLLVGRRLRERIPLVPYVFVVYGIAALVLAAACVAARQNPLGLPAETWLWLVLLALVPQLLGHSTFNWALRHLPAAVVAVALLGEPVGSAVLAYFYLGEVPGPLEMGGAALILAGIAVATRGAGPARASETAATP